MFVISQFVSRLCCFLAACGLVLCQTCPDPTEIEPLCTCYENEGMHFFCVGVQHEDQLDQLFTTVSFSTLNANEVVITDSPDLKNLTRNVFGELTFESILCRYSGIEYISDSAFANSVNTLTKLELNFCSITSTQDFPFDSLSLYTSLTSLYLLNAGTFDVLPKISSNTLETLLATDNQIQFLADGAFSELPSLQNLYLWRNQIGSVVPGMFDQNLLVNYILLGENNIQNIAAGTFQNLLNLKSVSLDYNQITQIEAGAFFNLPQLQFLYFNGNQLQQFLIENLGDFPLLFGIDISSNLINVLESHLFINSPLVEYVVLNTNQLTSIEAGTFNELAIDAYLDLNNNQLTTLDEGWLRAPLTNENTTVAVKSNPLDCGCDMAWLFAEPTLMTNLRAECNDGTSIEELDPAFFTDNC